MICMAGSGSCFYIYIFLYLFVCLCLLWRKEKQKKDKNHKGEANNHIDARICCKSDGSGQSWCTTDSIGLPGARRAPKVTMQDQRGCQ